MKTDPLTALSRGLVAALVLTAALPAPARTPSAASTATAARPTAEALDALPMAFEPNVGQTDARVKYLARGRGYTLFLTEGGATLSLGISRPSGAAEARGAKAPEVEPVDGPKPETLRLSIEGARPAATISAARELPGKANYLTGSDPSKWLRGVPTYAAVRYEGVYPGVDAVFYGTQRHLEYDFVVAPGADPGQIRVRFEGQQGIEATPEGDLVLKLANGRVRHQRAVVYQEGSAGKREVEARYVLGADGEVSFDLGEYDRAKPLTIDPILYVESFLGGSASSDAAENVAVDASGAAYVVGATNAFDFPATPGALDPEGLPAGSYPRFRGYVAKISPGGGALVYSTYLGGTEWDWATAVAVDAEGRACVAGSTSSEDFPVTPGAFDTTLEAPSVSTSDVFVAKLSADGSSLLFATFLGGAEDDRVAEIALGAGGSVHLAGTTESFDYPVTPNAFDITFNSQSSTTDGFITKLSADGSSLVYSSFLGGFEPDVVNGLAVDASGAAYLSGTTTSSDFPTTAGAYDSTPDGGSFDAFVAKVAPDGASLAYSTVIGGTGSDYGHDVAVDATGAAHVIAISSSAAYPTTPGAYPGPGATGGTLAYVTKLAPTGATLAYSARLGETVNFYAETEFHVALDASGAAFVAGFAEDTVFPATPGAYDTTSAGHDGFVAKLSDDGSTLLFSSFLGGHGYERMKGIAVGPAGDVFVAGTTDSHDFPTTAGAIKARAGGYDDGFVSRLSGDGSQLLYSTYLSGSSSGHELYSSQNTEDEADDVAVDASGALYVTGVTGSTNFPATDGSFDPVLGGADTHVLATDAFVTKLAPGGGSVVYSTFLGGSGFDRGLAVAVDASGAAYVTGRTDSADYPTTPGAFDTTANQPGGPTRDAFVSKLAPDGGALAYSTYLGGGSDEEARGIAVGADGSAYVTGYTTSADFPATAGAFDTQVAGTGSSAIDGFVAHLSPDGASLVYATYLGGVNGDYGNDVAVDAAGAAFVVGESYSGDFPKTPGAFTTPAAGAGGAFVTKVAPGGATLAWSAMLAGTSAEGATGVAATSDGAAVVAGWTASADFPTTPGAYDTTYNSALTGADAFVTKVGADGSALVYSTFVGGQRGDRAEDVAVAADGTAFLAGWTESGDYPTTPGAHDEIKGFFHLDAFVTGLGPDGSALVYSSFLGGEEEEIARAVAVDAAGVVHVVGKTESRDFAATGHGGRDLYNAFVVTLAPENAPAVDSVGVYVPETGSWFLRNTNSFGGADVVYNYGPAGAGLVPLSGDWDGDGVDTAGLYNPTTGAFFLRNAHGPGGADVVFTYGGGGAGIVPLAGDWDGDGDDTIGLYVKATGAFFLKNSNAGGGADLVFTFGGGGDDVTPLAGDWDGDGVDTIGLHVVGGVYFLRNETSSGPADLAFTYGDYWARPVTGDWNGDGVVTIGSYSPFYATWHLRNSNSPGPAYAQFGYGPANATAVAGNWDGQ